MTKKRKLTAEEKEILARGKRKSGINKEKVRKFLLGSREKYGFIKTFLAYAVLIAIGFVFMYPILKMISTSFMSLDDLLNGSITWLPSKFQTSNYKDALNAMDYWKALKDSLMIAGIPTLIQVVVCGVVGYGFARFNFFGKKLCIGILILAFVLPQQILITPTYVVYSQLGLTNSLLAYIVPALLGQGIKAPIFILIYMSFYRQIPQSLVEAASIDGAGYFKSFFKIAIPSATGAMIVVLLFSFVWYWNESYLTNLYITGRRSEYTTIITSLSKFDSSFDAYANSSSAGSSSSSASINEAYRMAGTVLSVLPLMILYFIMQRYFVESIDNAGITGE